MVKFLSYSKFLSASVAMFGSLTVPDTYVAKYLAKMYWLLIIDLSIVYFNATFRALDVEIKVSLTSSCVS